MDVFILNMTKFLYIIYNTILRYVLILYNYIFYNILKLLFILIQLSYNQLFLTYYIL